MVDKPVHFTVDEDFYYTTLLSEYLNKTLGSRLHSANPALIMRETHGSISPVSISIVEGVDGVGKTTLVKSLSQDTLEFSNKVGVLALIKDCKLYIKYCSPILEFDESRNYLDEDKLCWAILSDLLNINSYNSASYFQQMKRFDIFTDRSILSSLVYNGYSLIDLFKKDYDVNDDTWYVQSDVSRIVRSASEKAIGLFLYICRLQHSFFTHEVDNEFSNHFYDVPNVQEFFDYHSIPLLKIPRERSLVTSEEGMRQIVDIIARSIIISLHDIRFDINYCTNRNLITPTPFVQLLMNRYWKSLFAVSKRLNLISILPRLDIKFHYLDIQSNKYKVLDKLDREFQHSDSAKFLSLLKRLDDRYAELFKYVKKGD